MIRALLPFHMVRNLIATILSDIVEDFETGVKGYVCVLSENHLISYEA